METESPSRRLGRRARKAATLALALVSLRSLRKGKRLRGVLAGVGAVALGYRMLTMGEDTPDTSVTNPGDGGDEFESPATASDETPGGESVTSTEQTTSSLTCAVCDEPIVPGQKRGPDETGEIVHDDCR